jgi:hypothetical protein
MLAVERWRGFVRRPRTQLTNAIDRVHYGHPCDRLQGQHVCRNDGEKPPQELA